MPGAGVFSCSKFEEKSMRKTVYLWIVCMLLPLCACQPTPENEAVVNKRDGVYEQKLEIAKETEQQSMISKTEKAEESSAPAPTAVPVYEFEPHWTDTVSLRNFDVTIDVDVEAPTVANFPVYRVTSSQFAADDDRIQTVCKVLMGEVVAVRSGGATIQDLKEKLELIQLGEYDPQTKTRHPYDSDTYKKLFENIMKEMEVAPDENVFSDASEIQLKSLPAEAVYKNKDGILWAISCTETSFYLSRYPRSASQPERWVISGDAILGEPKGTTLQNVSCTEKEARQYVKSFFDAIDIGEMNISKIEKGRVVDIDTLEILKEGWVVECARTGGNCSAVNYQYIISGGSLRYSDDAYSAGLNPEGIVLFVDDEGVASFSWNSPLEIVKKEVDNIEILPFEQAQELMRQAMYNGLSWTGNKETGSAFSGAYVRRIALSYCFTPVKDNPDEFYFTPTWFVIMQFNGMAENVSAFSFALNAVDGTRIDLSSVG